MVNQNKRIFLLGLILFFFFACLKVETEEITGVEFSCNEFLKKFEFSDTLPPDLAAAMQNTVDNSTPLIAYQWVCLKNGSVTAKNVDYLKTAKTGKYGRYHPYLKRLEKWAVAFFSGLSRHKRSEQIAILERISSALKNIIVAEEKIFTEGLREFKNKRLSLENLVSR